MSGTLTDAVTGPTTGPATDERSAIRNLRFDVNDRPFIVIWEVTRACALACAHCRADAITRRDPAELSTAEGKALLDDLADLGAPRPIVVLTGGDPFERDDLNELVAHGTASGLAMGLSPSVTPRLTPSALTSLREAGASVVSLSIDGATATSHDAFRGVDGVFAATLDAARAVHDAGLRLQLNTTVTGANATELPDILRLVVELGAGLWSVFFLVPTGRGTSVPALDADAIEDVLVWLTSVADRVPIKATEAPHFRRVALQSAAAGGGPPAGYRPGPLGRRLADAALPATVHRGGNRPPLDVNAGKGFAFVDHRGEVYPSGFLPLSVGSIRDRPFTEIYRTSPLLRSLRDPERLTGRCGRCDFRSVCGGSRSRAYAVSGDPLGDDPSCAYEPTV
jgi:radical SAM protein